MTEIETIVNDKMNEARKLDEYPGYLIYSDGRVYSEKSKKFMKLDKTGNYLRVSLVNKQGKAKSIQIHRLVALAFLPNPENKPQVNHKDRNGCNNHVDNLEWVTGSENMQHVYQNGHKTNKKKVLKFKDGNLIEEYNSVQEAAESVNGKAKSLSNAISRKERYKSYNWELKNKSEELIIDGEIWKLIVGNEKYQISNFGRCKRIYKTKEKFMLPWYDKGYVVYQISPTQYAHRLVAAAFIGEPKDGTKYVVNHKDGVKTNNRVENLEYVTHSENSRHAVETGLVSILRPVDQYSEDGVLLNSFKSIADAMTSTGCEQTNISGSIDDPRRSMAGGFVWRNKGDPFNLKPILHNDKLKRIIDQYDINGLKLNTFESIRCAAEYMNCSESLIGLACSLKNNVYTARGYVFRYAKHKFEDKPIRKPL